MSRRSRGWLAGGWLVLVVAGWSFTEAMNDGIEPTSGPRPKPSSSSSSAECAAPTTTRTPPHTQIPTLPVGAGGVTDYYVEPPPDRTLTAVACKAAD